MRPNKQEYLSLRMESSIPLSNTELNIYKDGQRCILLNMEQNTRPKARYFEQMNVVDTIIEKKSKRQKALK